MHDTTLAGAFQPQGREDTRSKTAGNTMMTISHREKRSKHSLPTCSCCHYLWCHHLELLSDSRSLSLFLTEQLPGKPSRVWSNTRSCCSTGDVARPGNTFPTPSSGLLGIPIAVMIARLLDRKELRFVSGYGISVFISGHHHAGSSASSEVPARHPIQAHEPITVDPRHSTFAWLTDPNTVIITIALVGISASLDRTSC